MVPKFEEHARLKEEAIEALTWQEDHEDWFAAHGTFASSDYLRDERRHERRPGVKFTFNLDPMNVEVTENRRPFYKFITSVSAIIGGVYIVFSLGDRFVDSLRRTVMRTLGKRA